MIALGTPRTGRLLLWLGKQPDDSGRTGVVLGIPLTGSGIINFVSDICSRLTANELTMPHGLRTALGLGCVETHFNAAGQAVGQFVMRFRSS